MGIVERLPAERVKSRVLWARNFTQALHNGDIHSAGYPALIPSYLPNHCMSSPRKLASSTWKFQGLL
jgi:hypothetical protein